MRKLQLNPESLEIESFSTAPAVPATGTVNGHGGAAQPVPAPPHVDSGCVATYDPCTCVPIETCSCGPDTPDPTGWA